MKDTAKITDLCHTGRLEGYHSMMLKYCAKPGHFSHLGIVARARLATLDNNHNWLWSSCNQVWGTGRLGTVQTLLSRSKQAMGCKTSNRKKSCEYFKVLLSQVVQRCEEGNIIAQVRI